METNPAVIQAGFILLTAVMYALVMKELKKAVAKTQWPERQKKVRYQQTFYALVGWTVFISALALSGFLQNYSAFPPRIMLVLVVPLITMISLTFSKPVRELLIVIPIQNIVRLQVFRVFVEILLWMLFLQNILPVQMTFEGRNFDVLAGLTAPLAAYFLARHRASLITWNILSLGLLVNIMAIAILSLPTPMRVFMNEPANTIVGIFPYVWLPGLLVPLAYGLHFLSLRQLGLSDRPGKLVY
jgi:hypothetical protein